jgi:hypothetical protein
MGELQTKLCIPEVSVEPDKMSAKLRLHLDDNGQQFTVEDLIGWLNQSNVKAGILKSALQSMVEHDLYDIYTEVAVGKVPEKGKDGYFIFHVSNPEAANGPTILEDGSVEYVHTTAYTIVEEGDLLAEYVPATFGVYGFTVENEMRTPTKGKEQSPLRGRGFRVENGKYYSVLHGKVDLTETGIYVTNTLDIKGDVDMNSGHINFDGDVNIKGDVHSGMLIKASGSIEIKGHVGNCFINAGKDITIQQGMQGKFSGKLKAGGNIYCKFFENTSAEAKGDIRVRSVLHSKLQAEGKIIVEGRDSVVLGGSLHAIQGIEVTEAGNEVEVPTVLSAGVLRKTLMRNKELNDLIKEVEKQLELLDGGVKKMDSIPPELLSKELEEKRMKIVQAKVIKSMEHKQLRDEKAMGEALIQAGRDAQIVVQRTIYPGCKVEIAGMTMPVREIAKHVKFLVKDGNVQASLLY